MLLDDLMTRLKSVHKISVKHDAHIFS